MLALLAAISIPAAGQTAIEFALKDLDGNLVRLSDFRGKSVVLVDFWATWCVPCVKELPHFQRFLSQYKEKGLAVLAITVDGPESVAMVRPFVKRYNYTFPVLLDTESRVIALYNPRVVLPYTVLIDRNGNIRNVHQGYSPGDEKIMEEEILKLLEPEEKALKKAISVHMNEAFLNRLFTDKAYVDRYRAGRKDQIINQLDMSVASGDFLAGVRADANLDFSPLKDRFSLAKRFIEYNRKDIGLRAGDFYYSLGRGLMFSVLKTFEKEGLEYIIDTTVDGGKVAFSKGGLTAEAFGGWLDREQSSVKDKVLGGSVGWRFGQTADLKLNFLGSRLEPGSAYNNKDVLMESVSLDIPNLKDRLKFYGEFSLVQRKQYYSPDTTDGFGIYLESGLFLKNLTLLLEFKDYKNLDFEYNRPPLLESELVPIIANQYAKEVKDIIGASAKLDLAFPKITSLLFGKIAYFDDRSRVKPRRIADFFVGAEKKFKETGWLNVLAGWRNEETDSLIYYYTNGRTVYGQANLSYPITGRFSLEADIKAKWFNGQNLDYSERRSFLSFFYSPRWVVTIFFDQTDDPEILFFKNKRDWWGGQVEIKLGQGNAVRIYYGANKGGVKCSGGVCKFFPPFEGLRIDALLRF
jgi:peroxiredoxin